LPAPLVSIVIPAYNPTEILLQSIASAAVQTYKPTEIILVNDGSCDPKSLAILEQTSDLVDVYLKQPNQGPGAARNTGIRAARGEYIVPLDADDLMERAYIAECAAVSEPQTAFIYTDYMVFGNQNYREYAGDYNLYSLLERNFLPYTALIRREAWEHAGGYDESMRFGYEDWEFWLRLGSLGHFGRRLPKPLFRYRKHGASHSDTAQAHHREIVTYILNRHPDLYEYENRARIKARWSPAVSIITPEPLENQTIEDIQFVGRGEEPLAPAILEAPTGPIDPHAAELAALAAWSAGGDEPIRKYSEPAIRNRVHRHLFNAELLSLRSWTHHPARSLARLIPLRVKERVNTTAGRPLFDLSFYLRFQPKSVLTGNALIEPLIYFPKPAPGRKRVALVTPHLGPGGAESVLYEIASALCSDRFECLLVATQSRDDRWMSKWHERIPHIYDLGKIVTPERMIAALCSIVYNWRCDYLLIQNSLYGYSALPHIKKLLPEIKIFDMIHSVDEAWDQVASTSAVASHIDLRIALSESVRDRLLGIGTPESKIVLAPNGVNLDRFHPAPLNSHPTKTILFAARLNAVKRPLLVADIARALSTLRPQRDFRFIVAGDGPERTHMERRVHKLGLSAAFEFRGHVDDLAPLYAASEVVLLPSRSEGVPLVILEALASARPVVASNVGSIPEVLDSSCGILIDQPDPAQFARAIDSLLNQPEICEKMGLAGRRKMEALHDIRKTRETLAALFDQGAWASVSPTKRSTAME